jgi:phosphoribosylanthranilate isomerase
MTWVKICGTTNLEDALAAVEAGADALGFVFYNNSPRKVNMETAREIVAELPESVEKVGVFVDHSTEEIRGIVERAGLTAVQIHGTASTGLFENRDQVEDRFGVAKLIAVIPGNQLVNGGLVLPDEAKKKLYAILIDSGAGASPGGSGKTFDWEEAHRMVQAISFVVPVIVAGGLNSANVGKAMRLLQPWGVDVASGVELRPGKKDPGKVQAFVQAVRRAEKSA